MAPSQRYLSVLPTKVNISEGQYTSISLFSGMLGMDLGLHAAGFGTKVALDIDRHAVQVAKLNFPELPYLQSDIRNIRASDLLSLGGLTAGAVDLLAGGPPCQPFSKSGQRRGLSDERGTLFAHYVRLLQEIKPCAFVLENVRGILSSNRGRDFREILKCFQETGYTVYWRVLDAANYGVPQFRQRLFLVGFRERIRFSFPDPTHGEVEQEGATSLHPYVTVWDAIGDLEGSTDHRPFQGKYAHLLPEIPEGLNYSYYCAERGHPNPLFQWRSKYWYFLLKIDRTRPALTIQAHPGNNTGPFHWENRRLGVAELKRLQTIPDWFQMLDSYAANHKLIGNAVPPVLAHAIGMAIRQSLEENVPITSAEHAEWLDWEMKNYKVLSGRGSGKGKFEVVGGKVRAVRR